MKDVAKKRKRGFAIGESDEVRKDEIRKKEERREAKEMQIRIDKVDQSHRYNRWCCATTGAAEYLLAGCAQTNKCSPPSFPLHPDHWHISISFKANHFCLLFRPTLFSSLILSLRPCPAPHPLQIKCPIQFIIPVPCSYSQIPQCTQPPLALIAYQLINFQQSLRIYLDCMRWQPRNS